MSEPSPISDVRDSLSQQAANWARGIAVLIALLYAAGFSVVATYLGRYGVRDIEPLRAKYLAAGITFLLLAVWAGAVGVRVLRVVSAFESHPSRWHRWLSVVALHVGVLAAGGSTLLVVSLPTGPEIFTWQYALAVLIFSLGATLFVGAIKFERPAMDLPTWKGFTRVIAMVSLGLGALLSYASAIYPSLPHSLGGGRPETIELLLAEGAACPGCPVQPRLLDYDSHRVVILVSFEDGTEQAVEIPRDAVRSITHPRQAPFPFGR